MCSMRIGAAVLFCALTAAVAEAQGQWTVTKWGGDGNDWGYVENLR